MDGRGEIVVWGWLASAGGTSRTCLTLLPEVVFAAAVVGHWCAGGTDGAGKMAFYAALAVWVIGVAWWQREHGVEMFGQHDDGLDGERGGGVYGAERGAQGRDVVDEEGGPAVGQGYGEEERAAGQVITAIPYHGGGPNTP